MIIMFDQWNQVQMNALLSQFEHFKHPNIPEPVFYTSSIKDGFNGLTCLKRLLKMCQMWSFDTTVLMQVNI